MAYRRIHAPEVVDLLEKNRYYDSKAFTYNYGTKKVLYKGKVVNPDIQGIEFCRKAKVFVAISEYKLAILNLAIMNTPEPEKELDELAEPIEQWLEASKFEQIRVLDIIKEVFGGSVRDLTDRQLQMRVAGCLEDLGWKRVRTNKFHIWKKPKRPVEVVEVLPVSSREDPGSEGTHDIFA